MSQDLEDKLFAAGEEFFGFLWKHTWDVADRTFKLGAWLLLIGALKTLETKHHLIEFKWATTFLTAIWFAAAFVSLINAMFALQDHFNGHLGERFWVRIVVGFPMALGLLMVLTQFMLPFVSDVFARVWELAGQAKL